MADMPSETATPPAPNQGAGPQRARTDLWAFAAVAGLGLVCVTGLAVALAFILSKQGVAPSQVTASPVINIGASGSPAGPAVQRPAEPAKPRAERASAQDRTQPALPGVLAPVLGTVKREKQLVRAETQSPPAPAFPTPAPKVYFRVRGDAPSLWRGDRALPMPVRYAPDAMGRVSQVYATQARSAAPAPAAPEKVFADTGASAGGFDVQLSSPRETATLDGYRAPDGYQFFTTHVALTNKGVQPMDLGPDPFDIRDGDGVPYLSNPELNTGVPNAPVAAGTKAQMTLSFLVPENADLQTFALVLPGKLAPVLAPLAQK